VGSRVWALVFRIRRKRKPAKKETSDILARRRSFECFSAVGFPGNPTKREMIEAD
jgi:hypothetical protein